MKVFITGGTGFVGSNLTRHLVDKGHEVTILARKEPAKRPFGPQVRYIAADATRPGTWQDAVAEHDVLVNLAGVSIFKRWDDSYKKLLRDSRILTTRNLVQAIPASSADNMLLISTSAVGYYGMTQDEVHAEDSRPGSDFLAMLARDWEAEALQAQTGGTRVVITRFGVVLGNDAGALAQMALLFRFFVGGPVGNGRQWVSWIHIEDLCRAMLFVMENPAIRGPVNFTAPEPVRNRELSKAIGKALHRPSFMPAPGFMIKLVMGEFGSVILEGQRVVPTVLQHSGFSFVYPEIEGAVQNLLGG
jgi:uncharacterized protein (TIGR01777 family)